MKILIKKILREQFEYKEQLFDLLRSGNEDNIEMVKMISQGQDINFIELLIEYFKENNKPPYFKILKHFDLTEEELTYVLSKIFGEPVIKKRQRVFNQNGDVMYFENSNGGWYKKEYDDNGNKIYYEDDYGIWSKWEYDDNGNEIYSENSYGNWIKKEYNDIGRLIYRENSNGEIYDRR